MGADRPRCVDVSLVRVLLKLLCLRVPSLCKCCKSYYACGGLAEAKLRILIRKGILDRADFCAPAQETDGGLPVQIDTSVIDIDLYGVVWSSYLALHYFRKNASKAGKLIMTSSTAGVYATSEVPLYAAAKHGVSRNLPPRL